MANEVEKAKKFLDGVNKLTTEWKETNEKRETEVKKNGEAGSEILERMKKIESAITKIEEKRDNEVVSIKREKFETKLKGETPARILTLEKEHGRKFSMAKAYKGMKTRNWIGLELEQKVLISDESTGGLYIIPEEIASEFVDLIYAQTVIDKLPVFIANPTGNPFKIPKLSTGSTAYWSGESDAITPSEVTIDQISMTPKKAVGMVEISNEMIMRADPSAEEIVKTDMSKAIGNLIDLGFLQGTGSNDQPTGILNTSNIQEVIAGALAGTAAVISGDKLSHFVEAIEEANGIFQAWVMRPRTKFEISRLKDSNGDYLINEMLWKAIDKPPQLLGFPYYVTTQIPKNLTVGGDNDCTYILGGQWDTITIARWNGMRMDVSSEASYVVNGTTYSTFQRDCSLIRGISEVDIALRLPAVMGMLTEIKAT